MNPLYVTDGLTEEEILEKINKCKMYMAYEKRMGRVETIHSIEQVYFTLMAEYVKRGQDAIDKEIAKKGTNDNSIIELGKQEGLPDEHW